MTPEEKIAEGIGLLIASYAGSPHARGPSCGHAGRTLIAEGLREYQDEIVRRLDSDVPKD